MDPSVVVQVYNEVEYGLVTEISLTPMTPQNMGTLAATSTLGGKKRSKGEIKSFNSDSNDAELLVFTITLLNGIPQGVLPIKLTGSRPSTVRFIPNSIN